MEPSADIEIIPLQSNWPGVITQIIAETHKEPMPVIEY